MSCGCVSAPRSLSLYLAKKKYEKQATHHFILRMRSLIIVFSDLLNQSQIFVLWTKSVISVFIWCPYFLKSSVEDAWICLSFLISYITFSVTSLLMLRNNEAIFLSEDTMYSSMRTECTSLWGENPWSLIPFFLCEDSVSQYTAHAALTRLWDHQPPQPPRILKVIEGGSSQTPFIHASYMCTIRFRRPSW